MNKMEKISTKLKERLNSVRYTYNLYSWQYIQFLLNTIKDHIHESYRQYIISNNLLVTYYSLNQI